MSWRPDGKKAMWMEGQRSGGPARIRVVNLPDYQPAAPVAAKSTPDPVSYGSSDLSVVKPYASASHEIGRAPSELQSLMRITYAVFCVKKKTKTNTLHILTSPSQVTLYENPH